MAEVLAAVAAASSVIAVIQITGSIITTCKAYIEIVKDVPSDLHFLLVELTALKTIFEVLNSLTAWNAGVSSLLDTLLARDGPIEGCRQSLAALQKLLPASYVETGDESQSKSKKWKTKDAVASLAWPFKQSKVRKLLDEITQYKETITLALMTKSTKDICEIKNKASEIHAKLTDSQRQDVYGWLKHTDPSPLHHRAQKNYEPGTGEWALRHPAWANWLEAKRRCIWIHGIPGAGKTVLMSYLIERVKKFCERSREKVAFVYYYFYFGNNQDEASPFLRWILNQLCRQADNVPSSVYKMYKYGGEPSLEDLLTAITDVLALYDFVYVLCDAIDESNPREHLLKVLRDLATDERFEKLQLLASSREYIDIENVMKKIATPVSMANPFVEKDIRLTVHSTLRSKPHFRHWSHELLEETENSLAVGAKGMFRWAICQIDVLRRLTPEREIIQNALANLPKTIFETYDRIFLGISEKEQQFVYLVLQWISFWYETSGFSIVSAMLLKVVAKSMNRLGTDQNERFYNEDILNELCGCLITTAAPETFFQVGPCTSIAHYTVHEYLDSIPGSISCCAKQRNYREFSKVDLIEIIFSEALQFELSEPTEYISPRELVLNHDKSASLTLPEQEFGAFSIEFAYLALKNWPNAIAQSVSLYELAMHFLSPLSSTNPADQKFTFRCPMTKFVRVGHFEDIGKRWRIEFFKSLKAEPVQLFNLLCCSFTNEVSGLALIDLFLQRMSTKDHLEAQLNYHIIRETGAYTPPHELPIDFEGPVIEIFAQSSYTPAKMRLLLEHGIGFFDPSRVLFLTQFNHHHHGCVNYGSCVMDSLLELGADPNLKGYQLTPLQVAVSFCDLEGVKILLNAGADPNHKGSSDGIFLAYHLEATRCNDLLDLTPLQISKRHLARKNINIKRQTQIKTLLLEYGARESTVQSPEPKNLFNPMDDGWEDPEVTTVQNKNRMNEREEHQASWQSNANHRLRTI